MKGACCSAHLPEPKTEIQLCNLRNENYSNCILSPIVSLPLLALPPHQAQTIEFLASCSTHLLPIRNRTLGSVFLDAHAGPKLSLGHMPSFVVTGVRGTSLAEQILLNKTSRNRSCSLVPVPTSGCMLYKQ